MKLPEKNEKKRSLLSDLVWIFLYPFVFIAGAILSILRPTRRHRTGFGLIEFKLLDEHRCHFVVFNPKEFNLQENLQMITVKATQPDAPFTLSITSAADAEGNPIPASSFTFEQPQTDNVGAVEILSYDPATASGVLRFGASNPDGTANIANLTVNVVGADGNVAGLFGEQIAVTYGDVATFEGGFSINLEPVLDPVDPVDPEPVAGGGDES